MSKDKPQGSAKEFFPARKSLKAFRESAADCKACDLWKRGANLSKPRKPHILRRYPGSPFSWHADAADSAAGADPFRNRCRWGCARQHECAADWVGSGRLPDAQG